MKKWKTRICVAVIVALFVLFGIPYYCNTALRHRTEIGPAKEAVARVQRISPDDVDEIFIDINGIDYLILKAPKDKDDIERVINSLKQIRVADRECCWLLLKGSYSGRIVVRGKKPGSGVNFWGHFDPRRAPIVSKSMRSDDLGKVINDIFKRRGITPRYGH